MFSKSEAFYDAMYSFKDYVGEAERLEDLIQARCPKAASLLDVACGTGMHLAVLKRKFRCAGMDLDPQMIDIASRRNPEVEFRVGDMRDFDFGRRFDVITCLFSSIGYAQTVDGLNSAVACQARHLTPGGLLMVEPWIEPKAFIDNHLGSLYVDHDDLKVARIHVSRREGGRSIIDFNYLVGTPQGVDHFVERHEMGLFTETDYRGAFEAAGLAPERDPEGLIGRGLYIGLKPAS
ncbi:MAG: class I SAM-dependent methyltransferase [Fimbriimonas ginsengisoli]|uniref:Class I SAM-dependent methyltransferase n=1 Tax=Fimbriimonas ginsengisoli TaxID=1005039 RepID=A0A931LSQ2_FIMGI|nr:class I SAM-dependent methyltransferase [Fimbriimonas ginsengisoli]